jgi:hypothetical protein
MLAVGSDNRSPASASVVSVGKWPPASQTCRQSAETTGVWLPHLWFLSVSGLPPAKHVSSQLDNRSLASASVVSVGKWPTASHTYRQSARTGVWLQHLWSLSVSSLPPARHAGSQLRHQESGSASVASVGKWPPAMEEGRAASKSPH